MSNMLDCLLYQVKYEVLWRYDDRLEMLEVNIKSAQ